MAKEAGGNPIQQEADDFGALLKAAISNISKGDPDLESECWLALERIGDMRGQLAGRR